MWVAEQELGRDVEPWEIVHHIDGDQSNNDPTNLQVMSRGDHGRLHHAKREMFICPGCGEEFAITPHQRMDLKERPDKQTWCSLECYRSRGRR